MNRKLIVGLVAIAACAALIEWSSCGSSSSATPTPTPDPPTPGDTTVSSVAITGGNAKAIPTEGVIASDGTTTNVSTGTTAFTVTFSAAMDPTTVTATNITLECPTGTTQTLGAIAATDSTNTVFTIATTGALPEKTICTATFGTGLTDAENHTLSAAATGTFTTGCSSSDPFTNASTIASGTGCWAFSEDSLSTLSIGANGLDLTRQPPPDGDSDDTIVISKTVGSNNISTSVTLTSATGLGTLGDNSCMLVYFNELEDGSSRGIALTVVNNEVGGGLSLLIRSANDTVDTDGPPIPLADISTASPLTLTLNRTGTTFTASYKEGNGATTPITIPAEWLDLDVGATPVITLATSSEFTELLPVTCTFSNFTISGGSATAPNPTGTTGGQD